MMRPFILTSGLTPHCFDEISDYFSGSDVRVTRVSGEEKVIAAAQKDPPRIVVIGSAGRYIDDDLVQVRRLKEVHPELPVVIISARSSEERAIAAFRAGVDDYFKVSDDSPAFLQRIADLLSDESRSTAQPPTGTPGPSASKPTMIGNSPAMRATLGYLSKVAATNSTVLITGETGTGKELAAELIHYHSDRAAKPMVAVNCAALPEGLAESELFGHERGAFTGAVGQQKGKFVQAHGGTIFLDEIGDMEPLIQAKILHSIERKVVYPLGSRKALPLDVRIIAATNRDPETLIEDGRFREDLFYRLNIARVNLVPLRSRREDIPALVDHAIGNLNRRFNRTVAGLTTEAMHFLQNYAWPGNVRELMNLLEATFINLPLDTITYADLPAYFRNMLSKAGDSPLSERRAIVSALLKTNWNKSRAAQQLNWSRMTLYRKIARHRIVESRNR
jgi:DNA-binding NtrC family response regulator